MTPFTAKMVCKAEVKALHSLLTPDCDDEFCGQIIAEMKRMLFNYLAPILGSCG